MNLCISSSRRIPIRKQNNILKRNACLIWLFLVWNFTLNRIMYIHFIWGIFHYRRYSIFPGALHAVTLQYIGLLYIIKKTKQANKLSFSNWISPSLHHNHCLHHTLYSALNSAAWVIDSHYGRHSISSHIAL